MSGLAATSLGLMRGGRRVLDGVSASLVPGCVTAILGPNGAGKSSLLLALAGLLPTESGAVLLDGRPLGAISARERGRRIGYLAQAAEVYWDLTVEAVVTLGRLPHRGAFAGLSDADRQAVARAMALTDVARFAARPVKQLSGGERARVLLARLVAGEPEVVLADEPLANLDPAHQADSVALFRALADAGAAVVLVLHDLAVAARVADRVLLLADGQVVAEGAPEAVLVPEILARVYGVAVQVLTGPDGERLLVPGGRVG